MGWRKRAHQRRSARAIERQLDFATGLAKSWADCEADMVEKLKQYSKRVRDTLGAHRPILDDHRVLEVGSGPTGAIFFFGTKDPIGVDPLADRYRGLFPWQNRARTLAVGGETLPFADESFDVVISDNVIDHAQDPGRIVAEIARVLKPGGMLYFTVNVHHPIYHLASTLHGGWNALGIPIEITPFADHTVHLTPGAARRLFSGLPLRILAEHSDIAGTQRKAAETAPRHFGDRLKRLFYKNVNYRVVATREGTGAGSA